MTGHSERSGSRWAVVGLTGLLLALSMGMLGMHVLSLPATGSSHHGVELDVGALPAAAALHETGRTATLDDDRQGGGHDLFMLCGLILAAAAGAALLIQRRTRAWLRVLFTLSPALVSQLTRARLWQLPTLRPPPVLAFSVIRC